MRAALEADLKKKDFRELQRQCLQLPERIKSDGRNAAPPFCNKKLDIIRALLDAYTEPPTVIAPTLPAPTLPAPTLPSHPKLREDDYYDDYDMDDMDVANYDGKFLDHTNTYMPLVQQNTASEAGPSVLKDDFEYEDEEDEEDEDVPKYPGSHSLNPHMGKKAKYSTSTKMPNIATPSINEAILKRFDDEIMFGTPKQGNVTKIVGDGLLMKRIQLNKFALRGDPTSKFTRKQLEEFKNEMKIAQIVNHENIVKFYDTKIIETDKYEYGYLLQELGTPSYDPPDHLNLRSTEFCKNYNISVGDIFCSVAYDFSRGLNHLHSLGFVGCDVKLKNSVMFDFASNKMFPFGSQKPLKFKLIDFGQAKEISDNIGLAHPFMPPECLMRWFVKDTFTELDEQVGNRKLDEYVLGCVLLDILCWEQGKDRRVSYEFQSTMSSGNGRLEQILRKVPSSNFVWMDGLIAQHPSKRTKMQVVMEKTRDELHKDFKILSKLPFVYDSKEDVPNKFCMLTQSDAY